MSPDLRALIYAMGAAVFALLTVYGVVNAVQAEHWLGLLTAAVNLAGAVAFLVANRHTPTTARRAKAD